MALSIYEKYPSPNPDESFTAYWESFLPKVVNRDNFDECFLIHLKVLVESLLYLDKLNEALAENGITYEYMTERGGVKIYTRPEVALRDRAISQVTGLSKLLGIVLIKDSKNTPKETEQW